MSEPSCDCFKPQHVNPAHHVTVGFGGILEGYYNKELEEWWNPKYKYCPNCGKKADE